MADFDKIEISATLNIPDATAQIQADLLKVQSQLKPINLDVKINNDNINSVQQQTAKVTASTKDLSSQLEIVQNRSIGAYGGLQKYLNQNSQIAEKLPNNIKEIAASYQQVQEAVSAGNLTEAKTSLQTMTSQITALRGEAREMNLEGKTFGENIGNVISKIGQWFSATTLVIGAIHELKDGIQTINDLNTAQTNIQMITGMSADQVGKLTKQYSDLASQLHETTTSIMSASEEFLRAGNSADETASLLQASTVMSKIAGQSQSDSAQSLISIMNAYHMSATDMMSVVDKLVAVDNTSATSTAELSAAIQKTAASAQASGVSFSQLVSWIGEVSSVSRQSADLIGTTFLIGGIAA